MKKKFITYVQSGKVKKAVLDEGLYRQLITDPTVEEIMEYESEILMEKRYAEKLGVSNNRTMLFG